MWESDKMDTQGKIMKSKGVLNMSTTAQKWGNSIGVRIPSAIAKQYKVEEGSRIEIQAVEGGIMLKPVTDKPTLEDLIEKCTPENSHENIDFGGASGRELI